MEKTKIDWCDSTWNPVTGCLHGCEYCYARGIAKRFGGWDFSPGMARVNISDDRTYICPGRDYYGEIKETEYGTVADITDPFLNERGKCAYPFGFMPTLHRYRLYDYIGKQGRNIFVCSMADLFGSWVPDSWIEEVFSACEEAPQHKYLFLSKNPQRYVWLQYNEKLIEKNNMWYGASVTDRKSWKKVVDAFGDIKCSYKLFISIEPILENVALTDKWDECAAINYMNWVIVGAETGRRKNKVIPRREWIEKIVEDCRRYNTPLFMKSSLADIWGEPLIQEFPEELQKGGGNEICS